MSDIKVCALLGSPRPGGNTHLLLEKAIEGVKSTGVEVQLFNLCQMDINPCLDCGDCSQTGVCSIGDDMDFIYQAIIEKNRFIIASPIFFSGLSAQTKTVVDRGQALWCEKYVLKRPLPQEPVARKGLLLLVGGMKDEAGASCAAESAKAFFRSISVEEHEVMACRGIDEKREILKHPDLLEKAYQAGKQLVSRG